MDWANPGVWGIVLIESSPDDVTYTSVGTGGGSGYMDISLTTGSAAKFYRVSATTTDTSSTPTITSLAEVSLFP